MALDISVRPVSDNNDRNAFIRLPWRLYAGDPCWAPPLIFDVKRRLSPKHNHYFSHAEAELFVAYRGSEPVGRISAQIDKNYDMHWGEGMGQIGWYESVDDTAVARALFDTAADWLRSKGRERMQGPYDFNINDECALLVDGFDTPPMPLMKHNLRYYEGHFEDYGFDKAQDLYAYRLDTTAEPPEDIVKFAEAVRARDDVVIRNWDVSKHKSEMEKWLEVYNTAWEKNWGAVKMSDKEFLAHSAEMRYLADHDLIFVAEEPSGKVMGMAMTLPNLNEYLIQLNGHVYNLFPSLWYSMVVKKSYKTCRVFTLGVLEEYRRLGIGAVFYHDTLMAAKKNGYQWGEMSWILESNDAMNRAIRHMGGEVYKTYRIYETGL